MHRLAVLIPTLVIYRWEMVAIAILCRETTIKIVQKEEDKGSRRGGTGCSGSILANLISSEIRIVDL